MKTTVEELGNNTVKVKVEVPVMEFEKGLSRAYKKLAGSVNIPGFRKGKVPKALIDNTIGREAVMQEAAEIVVPDVYPRVIDESGIEPIARPTIDIVQLEDGKEFVFSATVQVRPKIELGDLSKVEIEEISSKASKEDIDNRLEQMRERYAKLEVSKRSKIKKGDYVHFDFEGIIDGKPFQGGSASDYVLEIGSGSFIPGFEAQMEGMKRGADGDVQVSFPEDYSAAHLAGRDATFKVKIKEIKEKKVPELDEDFVKSVSEFETLKELRDDIAKDIEKRKAEQNKALVRNAVVEVVVEQAELELPSELLDRYRESIADEFSEFLSSQQTDFETYVQSLEDGGGALREQMNKDAEKRAKTNLVLTEVARKEKIKATEEELEKEIRDMAEKSDQDYDKLAAQLNEDDLDYLRQRLEVAKAVDILATRVIMTKKKVKKTSSVKKSSKAAVAKDKQEG